MAIGSGGLPGQNRISTRYKLVGRMTSQIYEEGWKLGWRKGKMEEAGNGTDQGNRRPH